MEALKYLFDCILISGNKSTILFLFFKGSHSTTNISPSIFSKTVRIKLHSLPWQTHFDYSFLFSFINSFLLTSQDYFLFFSFIFYDSIFHHYSHVGFCCESFLFHHFYSLVIPLFCFAKSHFHYFYPCIWDKRSLFESLLLSTEQVFCIGKLLDIIIWTQTCTICPLIFFLMNREPTYKLTLLFVHVFLTVSSIVLTKWECRGINHLKSFQITWNKNWKSKNIKWQS